MEPQIVDYCLGYYLMTISLNNGRLKYDRRNVALKRLDDLGYITVGSGLKMTLTLKGAGIADAVSTVIVADNLLDAMG